MTDYGERYEGFAEAFEIFAKYAQDHDLISADHDCIYAGDPEHTSVEDTLRLEQLHWHIDVDMNCFYHFV